MSRFKAVFFDKDGTLVENDPQYQMELEQRYLFITGKKWNMPYEKFIRIFHMVSRETKPYIPYYSMDDELKFFHDFYEVLLLEEGIIEDTRKKAEYLGEKLWYMYKKPFPETIEVLIKLSEKGYKLGVISDGPPSLEKSLEWIHLSDFFSSFTSSSTVGASKPSPIIYQQAMKSLDVSPSECIYIDDTLDEVIGARKLGMEALHLNRCGETDLSKGKVKTLLDVLNIIDC